MYHSPCTLSGQGTSSTHLIPLISTSLAGYEETLSKTPLAQKDPVTLEPSLLSEQWYHWYHLPLVIFTELTQEKS
ncbi:hypothetical protein XELAEV_18044562mg [Xenopus laevis]|uniref:Uncharacterized protein n=1 Tax=Xenopus laevis TaxID=8355 RepID=A0A974BZM8_XENLA|nr:hypothetical protein XELAEV_18044562mg [Xenopus laevis]